MPILLETRQPFFNCGHYVSTYTQVGGNYATTLFCVVMIRFLQKFSGGHNVTTIIFFLTLAWPVYNPFKNITVGILLRLLETR